MDKVELKPEANMRFCDNMLSLWQKKQEATAENVFLLHIY